MRRFILWFERFVDCLTWQPPAIAFALVTAAGVANLLGAQPVADWCFTGAVAVVLLFFALIGVRFWLTGCLWFGELWRKGQLGGGLFLLGLCLLAGAAFVYMAVSGAVAFVTKYWGARG